MIGIINIYIFKYYFELFFVEPVIGSLNQPRSKTYLQKPNNMFL